MHVSRYWINPKWKVNTKLTWTLRRASFIVDKFASKDHFCEPLLFANVQKTWARAQNTKPKQRLRLGRLGFRPDIALSWFWQVINGKLCCIDINHNWVFISPGANLFLHETWGPRAKVPYRPMCKYAFWWNQRTAGFRQACSLVPPEPARRFTLYIRQWLLDECQRRYFPCNASPSMLEEIQKTG